MKVSYIRPEDMEYMALDALCGFERKFGKILQPPVPLDDLVESYLGLTVQFKSLPPGVLGCLSVKDKIVTISEELDTYGHPQMEGRFNFTLAHEAGHELAHAPEIRQKAKMADLFKSPGGENTTILCRTGEQDADIEFQANYIGAALLMPKKLIHPFWTERYGDLRQRDMASMLAKLRRDSDFVGSVLRIRGHDGDDDLLDEHFRTDAKSFGVSPVAFCRRLKTLGLLGDHLNKELFARVTV